MIQVGIPIVALRAAVILIGAVLAFWYAFKQTPELGGVENGFIYRFFFGMGLLRGWAFLWFNMVGLFPFDGG